MKKLLLSLLAFSLIFSACSKSNTDFNYSEDALQSALEAEKDVFIDVFASWCPTCHANQPEIEAAIEAVGTKNLTAFKANYDTEKELLKRFEIISQSSYIFIPQGQEEDAIILGPGVFRQPQFEQLLLGQEPSF